MIRMHMAGNAAKLEWRVGDVLEFNPDDVVVLEADGDELSGILRDFHNLPFHNGRKNTWYGDMASMIAERTAQLSDKNRKEQDRRTRTAAK